jgi:flagellar hook-length control protein FliK
MGQVKKSAAAESAKTDAKKFFVDADSKDAAKSAETSADASSGAVANATPTSIADKKPVIGPTGMMVEPKANSKDDAMNIREVIKQAQVMLRKGGGEMKLEMSPEGMGKVHLRVAVENGQVNLQMITESDAAKKLLENGLHELKAGLAAHRLHVEHAQVEIGREIQKQMDQQASQEQARQQARQSAMDFMGGFRENNEGFRQMFGDPDFRGNRGYGRPERRGSMGPEPVASASSMRSMNLRGGSDGRRLNLIA